MRLRRSAAAGAAGLWLALVTGCTGSDGGGTERADAPAGQYRLPDGAPEFCVQLADAESLQHLAPVVGRLLVDPEDTRDAWRLTSARGEFEDVREAVRRADGHPELETALDKVIDALALAAAGPLADGTVDRIVAGLDAVGTQAQPICEFPV